MAREERSYIRVGGCFVWIYLLLMAYVFFEIQQFFLSILLIILCIAFTIWSIYDIIESKKPSLISPEESKKLNESLEREEVKRYIQYLHKTKNKDIYNIARKVGKRFDINLIFKKERFAAGVLKPEIADKICMILGFKNYEEYWIKYKSKGVLKGSKIPVNAKINTHIELTNAKSNAVNYFNLGNYSEALKWYERELSISINLGLGNSSDAIKTREIIKILKDLLK